MARRLVLFAIAACVAMSAGCASAKEKLQKRYEAGLRPFNLQALEDANIEPLWQATLSTEGKGSQVDVRQAYVYDNTILIESQQKILYAFDRASGDALWVAGLVDSLRVKPTYHDRRYYSVSNGRLTTIDSKGYVKVGLEFPLSPTAPLVMTEEYIYAVSSAGGLHKLDRAQLLDVWPAPARAQGVILDMPVMLEDVLLFASSAGEVIGVDFITGGRRIDLKDQGKILTGVITDGTNFFFGSGDYYVYCYTLLGSLKWHTILGGQTANTPFIAGTNIYVDTVGSGSASIRKANGEIVWKNDKLNYIVATDGTNMFATAPMDELWLMNATTGEVKERVDIHEFGIVPRNLSGDGLVYLISEDGRIRCLRAK